MGMARKGFPVHRQNLILPVKKVIEATERKTRYLLNGTPGHFRFEGFLRRHPKIKQKYAESLCDENGVILISLLPNTTHIMQPADVSMFRPLKARWASEVKNWKFENFPKDVTRSTLGTILKFVFDKYASDKTIRNNFRKSGLKNFAETIQKNTKSNCIEQETPKRLLDQLENKIEKRDLEEFLKAHLSEEDWFGDISYLMSGQQLKRTLKVFKSR
ncbi:hypothetical protein ILUMI_15016 [Ignelater luminosus]|uniref:DDE-1 domain-containing protein n=1 Tax=Ignelater luminosus TaxID=2038154 RepID=A0A8K0CVH1_IGNLU|nr:hypothetical protein ILUMI_15016 [Ignelater luminosus]